MPIKILPTLNKTAAVGWLQYFNVLFVDSIAGMGTLVPCGATFVRFGSVYSSDLAHVFSRFGGPRSVVAAAGAPADVTLARPLNTLLSCFR